DWHSERYLRDKLLVPILGDQYGVELYGGKLRLKFGEHEGSFAVLAYGSHKLPVCPLHYARIFGNAHNQLERLGDAFASLPEWRPQAGRRASELKQDLARSAQHVDVCDAITLAVQHFNGVKGDERSWKALDRLIQDQFWRVANFRVAADDI